MAKDAKGHGSDAHGIAAMHGIPTAHLRPGQFTREQLIHNYAVMHGTAAATKAAPRLTGGRHKVQTLALGHAGPPWATQKAYRNRTVAERVAGHMRTDGGYTRVKTK